MQEHWAKRLCGAAFAIAALTLASLPVQAEPTAPRSRHFVTEPFPPYTFERNGRAAGPMVDVLLALCNELRWTCRIEVLPWRRALAMAQDGRADGIFTVVDTPERRLFFHVSPAVIAARYTLFSRAGEDFQLKDRQALEGRTIGVYGPSASVLALDDLVAGLDRVKTVVEPDNRTVLRKLAAGRYGEHGLALVNESVALTLMRDEQLGSLQTAGVVREFDYAFGLSRKRFSADEARAFNEGLNRLCHSGRTASLLRPHAVPASACAKP